MATTSRYDSAGDRTYKPNDDSRTTSNSSTGSTGESNTNSSSYSVGTQDQTQVNLSGQNLAALNTLIQQLLSGGTPAMRQSAQQRQDEISTVKNARAGYSKDAAFSDATGLINQQTRRVLEQLMPSITRASEDAGSSGGALRALLTQDAANKAAESGSALGVKAAVDYGNVAGNLSQVLERLTQTDPVVAQALVAALGVAKGATVKTSGMTTESKTGTSNTTENKNVIENKNLNVDYAPFSVTSQSSTAPIYFGPAQDAKESGSTGVGSTTDFLQQLYGQNAWSGYEI